METDTLDELRSLFDFSKRNYKATTYRPIKEGRRDGYRRQFSKNKFDAERKDEMIRLRTDEKWSISKIGKYFGISRQRVAQIIGKVGRRKDTVRLDRKRSQDIIEKEKAIREFPVTATNAEIASSLGVSGQIVSRYRNQKRHAVQSENTQRGMRVEEIVSLRLTEIGIKNTLMPLRHQYDIELSDGKRVEVKSRFKTNWTGSSNVHSFTLISSDRRKSGQHPKDRADFYILVIGETLEMFVVPASILTPKQTTVAFTWPKDKSDGRKSRISCYFERFDLLTQSQ